MNRLTATVALLGLASSPLPAEQFGLFTYEVTADDTVVITDYPEDASGEVVIPSEIAGLAVTHIGDFAFGECTGLTSVVIPGSVLHIGDWAFFLCTGLQSIEVHALNPSYSSLEGVLFNADHSSLLRYPGGRTGCCYAIPDGVTGVWADAFQDCSRLTSISIPESLTTIGSDAFSGCTGLLNIEVAPLNPNFHSLDGVLFSVDGMMLIHYPKARPGPYSIPETVTSIAERAFSGCSLMTSVDLPQSVTEIGNSAFILCTALSTVTIASSVRIDHHAFERCTELQSMVFLGDSPELGTCVFLDGRRPTITVVGRAPAARVHDGSLSIRFDPSLRGFGWSALTSTDLNHWTTDGVSISEPDAEGCVTASVRMDGPSRFLRVAPRIPIQGGCHL